MYEQNFIDISPEGQICTKVPLENQQKICEHSYSIHVHI